MTLGGLVAIGGLVLIFAVFAFIEDPKQRTRGTSDAKVDTMHAPAVWTVLRFIGWTRIGGAGLALVALAALLAVVR